eukprot:6490617-Alexandrium_andersonii.AAC.1
MCIRDRSFRRATVFVASSCRPSRATTLQIGRAGRIAGRAWPALVLFLGHLRGKGAGCATAHRTS